MVDVDLRDGFGYPARGDEALTIHAIGGGLPVALGVAWLFGWIAALLVPDAGALIAVLFAVVILLQFAVGALWLGYFVRVARRTFEGGTTPPAMAGPGELARDGLVGAVVTIVYGAPAVIVLVVVYGITFAVPLGTDLVGSAATLVGVAAGVLVVVTVGTFVLFAYGVAAAYLLPASLVVYAEAGSVAAAFSPGRLGRLVTTSKYVLPWVAVASGAFAVAQAVSVLTLVLVGYLLAPLLPLAYFYLGTAGFYMFARAYASETGMVAGSSAESSSAESSSGGSSVPPPPGPPGDSGSADG